MELDARPGAYPTHDTTNPAPPTDGWPRSALVRQSGAQRGKREGSIRAVEYREVEMQPCSRAGSWQHEVGGVMKKESTRMREYISACLLLDLRNRFYYYI